MRKLNFFIVTVACIGMIMFSGCSQKKAKLEINDATGKLYVFDADSNEQLFYSRLAVNGKEVVSMYCAPGNALTGKTVAFAFNSGDITIDGNTVTMNGGKIYTEHAVFRYKLQDDLLTLYDK